MAAHWARPRRAPVQDGVRRVEAAGIEPASAVAPDRASTSVVCALISPGGRFAADLPTGQPSCDVAPPAIGSPSAPSPFVGAAPGPRAEPGGASLNLSYLGSECEIIVRICIVSRWINEADRGPRLAALPENRPRRNQVAPVCCCPIVAVCWGSGDRGGRTAGARRRGQAGTCRGRTVPSRPSWTGASRQWRWLDAGRA